ncbi:MAG: AAA family ATPase [Gammaproteobacteria bacterium]
MYLEHFGLKEPPFSLTPDTHFWFEYTSHHDALNVLTMALRSGEGFIKVTGEVGLGKTLICRKLLNGLGDGFVTAYIPNPHLSPASMRVALADELGLDASGTSTQEQLLRLIANRLLELAREGKRVVLCLDEAQELPDQTLEAVRLLTNLETEKFKLLQVVLFGQPELEQRLAQPHLRQLKQRITFSHVLRPLTREAAEEYVNHRLRVAGYRGAPLFARDALDAIYHAAEGTPRLMNVLCHKALLSAFGPGAHQVVARHARAAIEDTNADGSRNTVWWRPAAYGSAFIAIAAGAYMLARWLAEVIA